MDRDADQLFKSGRAAAPRPDGDTRETIRRPDRARSLLSSSLVGSTNRGRVLQALFDLGPTSRVELARQAGVNKTTISGIVQPLLDRQILVEGEPNPSQQSGGKPARPLWFSPAAQPICGVLLMPGTIRTSLVTLEGKIEAEHARSLPTELRGRTKIIDAIAGCIARTFGAARRSPLGIGVAVGGMVDTDRRSVVAVNLAPALDGVPLGDELARRFDVPIMLDHHPRALLVGERWFGKGRGVRDFAVVYTGEVLGGALYLDGHLHRGHAGAGGELGHTFVQVDGELCRCGRRGCWDTIATLGWLRREARAFGIDDPDEMNSKRLVTLASAKHPTAAKLLDRYARNVAVGIANLQQTVAPNFFILHGDVVGGGDMMITAITEHVKRLVPPRPGGDIVLTAGAPGDRAALLGAAGLVLSDLLQFPL